MRMTNRCQATRVDGAQCTNAAKGEAMMMFVDPPYRISAPACGVHSRRRTGESPILYMPEQGQADRVLAVIR
jgi:hypothetical protein